MTIQKSIAPRFGRDAEVRSASFNETDNSVEVVWTTGASVRRRDWQTGRHYNEILEVSSGAVRLDRLNAGAPFLDTHDDWSLRSVIGSVVPGSAKIVAGKGVARIRLSNAPGDADLVSKIKDGIIRNVSVGYAIHKVEKTERDDGSDEEWRVVDWEPLEISAVPVPADAGSQIRSSPETNEVQFVIAEPDAATRVERDRTSTILELATEARALALGDLHIKRGTSVDAFRAALLSHLVEQEAPHVNNTITTHTDSRAQQRAAAIHSAILHRVDPSHKLADGARDFRGMSLLDMARDTLEVGGTSTRGMSREEIAARALAQRSGYMSTSDFPVILGNIVNTTLRSGYEAAGQTFRPLVRETTVPDFKEVSRAQLGEAPSLDKVNEHGEFKRGHMTEGSEKYKIATYGKIIAVTRQVIINDDMNAFARIPSMFGVQAAQLESDLVWHQILANPVMGDGKALFHADHNNIATPAALDIAPLGKMRSAMSKQTGLDGKTVLNIRPQYLVVPVDLELDAERLLRTTIYPAKPEDASPESMRRLQIIADPRLDNGINNSAVGAPVAGSSKAYYLAASPSQLDTVELAYLEGNRGVYTESRSGFDVDGLEIKVRLDVGAKVIDWRAFTKNVGA